MKVLLTNWINLLGIFTAVFVYAIFLNISEVNISRSIFQSIVASLILVCLYGVLFWSILIITLILFDFGLIIRNPSHLKIKLIIEWLIISIPFIYWIVKYQQWIFLVAIIVFLITQLLRENLITKALNSNFN